MASDIKILSCSSSSDASVVIFVSLSLHLALPYDSHWGTVMTNIYFSTSENISDHVVSELSYFHNLEWLLAYHLHLLFYRAS